MPSTSQQCNDLEKRETKSIPQKNNNNDGLRAVGRGKAGRFEMEQNKRPLLTPSTSSNNRTMVVIQIKTSDSDSFLYETTCDTSNDAVIRDIVNIWNTRLRLAQLVQTSTSFCPIHSFVHTLFITL